MKNWKVAVLALVGFSFVVSGCAKKSTEQASINGTGFDTFSNQELAQLPQSSTVSQQAGVEVLPIETSPITQGVPPIAGPTMPAFNAGNTTTSETTVSTPTPTEGTGALTAEQRIQTALKNAGLYQGAVDGKLGPASKAAIQEFQRTHNLKVDGKVGPKTLAALEPYLSGAPQTTSTENVDQ